jgi:hypothetical protein
MSANGCRTTVIAMLVGALIYGGLIYWLIK